MTNLIAIANRKYPTEPKQVMIMLVCPSMDFLKVSFHQVESPLVLDQGTQHLLCPCMYMCLLHVDTCGSPL